MSAHGDYMKSRDKVVQAALFVAAHEYDPPEDPGWQAELDDERLDEAVTEMAAALVAKKEAENQTEAKNETNS